MKRALLFCFTLCMVLVNSFMVFGAASAYDRAMNYLETRGEVYFKFNVNLASDLSWLTDVVSVDNVKNSTEVFAYANKDEFSKFLGYNYEYEVLTPPGLQTTDVRMAKDVEDARQFTSYPNYPDYVTMMQKFQTDYPALCKVDQFGTSLNNRKLMYARVTSSKLPEFKKPKFFYQSTIHGDETTGWITMMRLIDYLCKEYGKDARITRIVDSIDIFINPNANPDGTYKSGDNSVSGAVRYNKNNIDLNRNYPKIGLESSGRQQRVEQENQATIAFCDKHTFVMSADFHGGAELTAYIWGCVVKNHPDKTWWVYVGTDFSKTCQENGPTGYMSQNGGCINGYAWYYVTGERMNYAAYNQKCRDLTIEVSTNKLLAASDLDKFWGYLYKSCLAYIEESLCGIRGVVTDSITNKPLKDVKVFVKNHDMDNSNVFTGDSGHYYRPIQAGTFTLEISKTGYQTKTVANVTTTNKKATILNVKLWDGSTEITETSKQLAATPLSIVNTPGGVRIYSNAGVTGTAAIYDVKGTLLRTLTVGASGIVWDGKDLAGAGVGRGCYVARLASSKHTVTQSFIYTP